MNSPKSADSKMASERRPLKTLERVLSKAGLGSRSEARSWIGAGRVKVNGKVLQNPDHWIDMERDNVTLDGKPIRAQERIYLLLYKPPGYVTTHGDPEGRPTVYDLIGDAGVWVAPVGRLDLETSGLLILTNDTQFAERLTNPEYKVSKTYQVKAAGLLSDDQLERLRQGVELSDGPTRPARVTRLRDTGRHTHLEMTITEGRNRQVRRMLEAVDSKVLKLARTAIGPIRIGDLPIGKWRALTGREVEELRSGMGQNRGKLILHVSHPRESSTDERLGNRPHARPPGPRNSGKKRRPR